MQPLSPEVSICTSGPLGPRGLGLGFMMAPGLAPLSSKIIHLTPNLLYRSFSKEKCGAFVAPVLASDSHSCVSPCIDRLLRYVTSALCRSVLPVLSAVPPWSPAPN